jgi:hypothetical protein
MENDCQDIVEGLTLSKSKEETAYRIGAICGGTPVTLGTFSLTDQKKDL